MATLIGPDSRRYDILDGADLQARLAEAQKLGYRLETEAEPQTTGEKVLGGVADVADVAGAMGGGGLQGVTAGAFGAALRGNQQARQALEAQKEEHPIASTVGDFGGMLLNPINELAKPIEAMGAGGNFAARLGSKAAGQGAVNSLFGAGNYLSDAALGDQDLSSEKMFSAMGMSGLLGSTFGALGAGAEELPRAMRAVGDAADGIIPSLGKSLAGAKGPLEEFANQRWLKAGGAIQKDLNTMGEPEQAAISDVIRQHMSGDGVLPKSLEDSLGSINEERDALAKKVMQHADVGDAGGLHRSMDQEAAQAALDKDFESHGAQLGDALKEADQAGALPKYSSFVKRIDDFERGLNPAERDAIKPDAEKIRGYLMEMGAQPVGTGPKNGFEALNDIKSSLQKGINYKAEDNLKIDLKKQLVGLVRDEIDSQLEGQVSPELARKFFTGKESFRALKGAEDALGRKSSTGADAIAALAEHANVPLETSGRLEALRKAADLAKAGMDRIKGNRVLSASDYLAGIAGVASGNPLGLLKGLGMSIGNKILREHGSAVAAKLADRIAASAPLMTVATSFTKQLPGKLPYLGEYGRELAQAAAQSPQAALAQHMVMAAAQPDYQQKAKAAGFQPETPAEYQGSLVKAHGLAQMAATIKTHDDEIDRHVDRVFKGGRAPESSTPTTQDFGAKRMRLDSLEGHNKRVDEIRQLAEDPQALLERTTKNLGNLSNIAPGVSGGMTRVASTAMQYLAAQAQTPPKAGPLAPDYVPSEAERYSFAKKLETVEEPMSVMRHAAAGTLTQEQVDALKAVYPSLYADISNRLLTKAVSVKSMPYQQVLMVGLLTGTDLDGTTSGAAIASNQATIRANSQKPGQPGVAPPSSHGSSKNSLAARTASPTDRLGTSEAS